MKLSVYNLRVCINQLRYVELGPPGWKTSVECLGYVFILRVNFSPPSFVGEKRVGEEETRFGEIDGGGLKTKGGRLRNFSKGGGESLILRFFTFWLQFGWKGLGNCDGIVIFKGKRKRGRERKVVWKSILCL